MEFLYLSCYRCEHQYKNDTLYQKRMNGKHIKPFDRYCGFHGKGKNMKRIGKRDIPNSRLHPAWCPLYEEKESCIYCAKTIYGDEGIACKTCKRKGL